MYNYRVGIVSNDSEKKNFNGSSILGEIHCFKHPYRLISMKEHDVTGELIRYWKCIHEKFSHKVQDLESGLNKNDTAMTVTATYIQ